MYSLILHGRRSLELQKWRNLIVPVQNVFSAFPSSFSSASAAASDVSPPQDGRKGKIFGVSYLVDSLGFTTELAESISRKVGSEGKGDPDSVLSLLRSHGFTDSQISSILTSDPGLLMLDAEKSLAPKLQFLQSRGASTSEVTEVHSKVPTILGMKGKKTVSLYYDFVKDIIAVDKGSKVGELSHSLPQGRKQEHMMRNLLALRELGVPEKLLFSLLTTHKRIVSGKEKFEESLKKIVDMGFDHTSPKFIEALKVIYSLSDKTTEEKVNVYKRLGFDEEDVWYIFKKFPSILALSEKNILNSIETFIGLGFSRDEVPVMVRRHPACIAYSTETVKEKAEFLMKKMNWPLAGLRPEIFSYSMEKRIIPRCNVVKALMSKGLIGSELPPVLSVLVCTNQVFLKRYVKKHDDNKELVAELMAIFTGGDRVGS